VQGRQHGDEVFPRHQEQHQAPVSTGRRRRVPAELHRAARRTDARHGAGRVLAAVALHRVLPQRCPVVASSAPLCLVDRRRRRSDSRPPSRRRRGIAFDRPATTSLPCTRVAYSNARDHGRTTCTLTSRNVGAKMIQVFSADSE